MTHGVDVDQFVANGRRTLISADPCTVKGLNSAQRLCPGQLALIHEGPAMAFNNRYIFLNRKSVRIA